MTRAGFIGSTSKYTVSASPASFTVDGPNAARKAFYMVSDTIVYLARNEGDASPSSMRLPADWPVLIECFAGDVVSYLGEGGGGLWVTQVDRT